MGRFYNEIPEDQKLIDWIREQKLFHVATAPFKGGHVNVSPKGLDTFKLMNRKACWYLDLTGSGNETISHLYEPGNGRMTILFQAFDGAPRLLRLFGKGRVIEKGSPEFDELLDAERHNSDDICGFPTPKILPGARAIIWLDITRVGTSCGYAVPFMKFEAHRNTLNEWARKREEQDELAPVEDPEKQTVPTLKGLRYYWISTNTWSVDGLPGMKSVELFATPGIKRSAMENCGLPVLAVKRGGSVGWVIAWLFGVVMGMLLLAVMQRGIVPSLRHLDLPFGRHLLEHTP